MALFEARDLHLRFGAGDFRGVFLGHGFDGQQFRLAGGQRRAGGLEFRLPFLHHCRGDRIVGR